MRPAFLDEMSWAMAEVYGAVTDRILVNLAHYFPYIKDSNEVSGSFDYQARMLAQMGQVNRETVDIIMKSIGGADDALRQALETAIMEALKPEEPKLQKAAKQGLLNGSGFIPPEVSPGQMQAFKSYYKQSADKLNLVNTVMLESTQAAYTATVSDIASKIQRTQSILNIGTGEVVTGVSAYNQAIRSSVQKMVQNGLTGYIDHGGHHWSPEAYIAMDIRTTMFNTSRAAIWERADDYGCDTYQVSSHNGARPLCYPWQGKIISRNDLVREVEDLDGNKVHVYAQSETTYGQAAGLFGVNCQHYPMTFIPGFSTLKGEPQDPEENAKAYEESQQQRALERKLREERRDLAVMKAQGAPEAEIKAQRERVKKASDDIDTFCDETGRARKKNREGTPINAKFPPEGSYNPAEFPTTERDKMNDWFKNGGNDNPPPSPTNIRLGPDDIPPQGQGQIPVEQPKKEKDGELHDSLSDSYEYHRKKYNLKTMPYDPNSENQFIISDLSELGDEARKTAQSTISELAKKYDTTLIEVRTATITEAMEQPEGWYAVTGINYHTDSSSMVLNAKICTDEQELVGRIAKGVSDGYFSPVPENQYSKYLYTHEFAHTLINTGDKLDAKTNYMNVDLDRVKRIRKRIKQVYSDYSARIGELQSQAREASKAFEEDFDLDAYERGKKLWADLKRLTVSKYSLTNADEFFAESFAYTELGGADNEYANMIRKIIDEEFRK